MRLKGYDYSQAGIYFVTACAHRRICLFGEVKGSEMVSNEFGQVVHTLWLRLAERYAQATLDALVLMPNHIHAIVEIADVAGNVGAIHELPLQDQLQRRRMLIPRVVGWLKMTSAKRINLMRGTPGVPVWQRNYWEHVVRNEESMRRIREYIMSNPQRWHLDRQNPDRIGEDDFDRWLAGPFSSAAK